MKERMKEERKRKNLSQKEIAKKIGIDQRTYSQYERNIIDIPSSKLTKICIILTVSADYLLRLSDIKEIK